MWCSNFWRAAAVSKVVAISLTVSVFLVLGPGGTKRLWNQLELWLASILNRNAVVSSSPGIKRQAQPPCGLESTNLANPRVAEAATLGWRSQPLCGFCRAART